MADEHCCKVRRAAETYDLTGPRGATDIDGYLVAKWTGRDHHEPTGLRPLTAWLNKRMLRTVYREHGRSATDVRVDAEYAALRGEDVAAHERADLLADLEADGIDPEALTDAFAGKSTLARHLRSCLGASKTDPAETGDWEVNGVSYARNAFQQRVESALQSLDRKGRLPGGSEAILETPVQLGCPECATRVSLETALGRGYVCPDHLADGTDFGESSSAT